MRYLAACVLLVGCSDYRSIDPQSRVAGWAQSELSCDTPPACEGGAPSHCLCAERPDWQLQNVNQNSERFMETFGLDAFDGKVTVLSFFKINCDFCEQQMGYLQVMQDQLASEGFEVEFATILKNTGEVGTTCEAAADCAEGQTCEQGFCHSAQQKEMAASRNSWGACALPRLMSFESANCDGTESSSNVSVAYPIFQDTVALNAWENHHDSGAKDEIYVYRADGRLAAYYSAAERVELAQQSQYRSFKSTLKALSLGKLACDADNPCAEGQWCRQPELWTCGGAGFCVPNVDADDLGVPICPMELYPQPVCGCDQKTYSSACVAASQGVSLFDRGHCLD